MSELGPPQGMSIKDWNKQRREELSGKRRATSHRTMIDRVGGCGKVRISETSRNKD